MYSYMKKFVHSNEQFIFLTFSHSKLITIKTSFTSGIKNVIKTVMDFRIRSRKVSLPLQ